MTKRGKQKYQMLNFGKLCFVNLARDKSSNHDCDNCSEISAVTWFRIWPYEIFVIFHSALLHTLHT